MKRFFCVLCLLLALICALAACGKEKTTNTPPKTDMQAEQQTTDTSTPPHAHTYGEWVLSKPATCSAIGEEKRSCECGASETRELDLIDHIYSNGACNSCSATEGLLYKLNESETEYTVVGNNAEAATAIVIPAYHQKKPVTGIGDEAFDEYSVSSPTSITLPETITTIGDAAFGDCQSLTSINIPTSVTTIGDAAFANCQLLTSLRVPANVTSIGISAFSGCSNLEAITVDNGNTVYHSVGNCLIETQSKTLIAGCKNSVLPVDGSVTSIGDGAFYSCSSLSSVVIPNSVISIGKNAFQWCGLESIIIPSSVKSIGKYAFYGCSSLTSITIPASVTSIGEYAFYGCSSLTSITIPASVTSIGYNAFYGCSSLTSVTFENTTGWWRATSSTVTSGTSISATDLADTSTAATYLKSTYYNYYWKRTAG